MGSKRKPAYTLANRDHFKSMQYTELRAYNAKALVPLRAKCNRLTKELIEHLVRLRVKHEVYDGDQIKIFPDADNWELRNQIVSFNPIAYNWPEVWSGRLRLSFLKSLESRRSPTWFRVNRVPVLEPKYGFDTLALAKDLQALRKEFVAKRKLKNVERDIVTKSRRLATAFESTLSDQVVEKFNVSVCSSHSDPYRFQLEIMHTVTPEEAKAILDALSPKTETVRIGDCAPMTPVKKLAGP